MKTILWIILLSSILFSSQKQIVVGSFLEKKYALGAVEELKSYIESDNELKQLIEDNSLIVDFKKGKKYYAVFLAPFQNSKGVLKTLRVVQKYYNKAYVIRHAPKEKVIVKKLTKVDAQKKKIEVIDENTTKVEIEDKMKVEVIDENITKVDAQEKEVEDIDDELIIADTENKREKDAEKILEIIEFMGTQKKE